MLLCFEIRARQTRLWLKINAKSRTFSLAVKNFSWGTGKMSE